MTTTDHRGANLVRIFADRNDICLTIRSDQNVHIPQVSIDPSLAVSANENRVIVGAGSDGEISSEIFANPSQPAFTISWKTAPRFSASNRFLKWLGGSNPGSSSIEDSATSIVDDGRPLTGGDHITEFSGGGISTRTTGDSTHTVVTNYARVNLTRGRGPIKIIISVPPGDRLTIQS